MRLPRITLLAAHRVAMEKQPFGQRHDWLTGFYK